MEAVEAPDPDVFWGFDDVFLFVGLACVSGLVSVLLIKPIHIQSKGVEALSAQFILYGFLFLGLYLMFKLKYARPFWRSLGYRPATGGWWIAPAGVALAFAISAIGALLKTPDLDTPMVRMLSDPATIGLFAVFGSTLGPLCEELAFRGLLQPLLVRSAGPTVGIFAAALPFGVLHLPQYGYSWRHALLITLAGAVFGFVRQAMRSTLAATVMHSAYNFTFFLALMSKREELPALW